MNKFCLLNCVLAIIAGHILLLLFVVFILPCMSCPHVAYCLVLHGSSFPFFWVGLLSQVSFFFLNYFFSYLKWPIVKYSSFQYASCQAMSLVAIIWNTIKSRIDHKGNSHATKLIELKVDAGSHLNKFMSLKMLVNHLHCVKKIIHNSSFF